jgi:hypothetical protein
MIIFVIEIIKMMKKKILNIKYIEISRIAIPITLILGIILFSCNNSNNILETNKNKIIQTLCVLNYDITLSNDEYAYLKENHLKQLYHQIGINGGGKFYGLHIKADSETQDPVEAQIQLLELLPEEGNAFQQENIKQLNEEKRSEFKRSEKEFLINIKDKFLLPKTEEATDVENALLLSKNILSNPEYKDWKKVLIIISDLLNEQPGVAGHEIKNPIQLPNDVIIAIVRPSKNIIIKTIFNHNDFTVFSSIDDAINSILK